MQVQVLSAHPVDLYWRVSLLLWLPSPGISPEIGIRVIGVVSPSHMPIVIFRACSWVHAVLSRSGSLKVLSMPASSSARVENVEVWDKTMLVSFSAQTCAIPPHMKERAYRIFILSSTNVSSCMVTAMQKDQTNC